MYRICKVLNHNGVIALDMKDNKEYVLLGKGVGFGKKVGERMEQPEECTVYSLQETSSRGAASELASSKTNAKGRTDFKSFNPGY